jgi:transcriptional regulator with XRE-family HTH domain
LLLYRQFRNWQEHDLASRLTISVEDYKNMEAGVEEVDLETALKLSDLYLAPAHIFLKRNYTNEFSIIYSQCHFEDSNGYVNHLYNENEAVLKVKDETIQMLKEEIKRLQNANDQLIALIKG